ncbi:MULTISPECIES: hypothetical protein [Paraburkholderia]|jgi:hypothetical protein|uniref:Uncharacterized protein n=1 Tax=Paraburkholderia caribensis TaxID=75105 RepID=A0A9Q6WQY6_9BURK|nr:MULTISPECIES: hypothetical protein [Paraburkholderia]ALP68114.1 hypothetical protein AN416_36895 [Paraburkholderia caribensis]AMV47147.1 hypothetical protein ATN79_41480 [Paraburkholderia caribensis]AUT56328.1 hypothetical protein C2L66_30965 [Paraburkholderia caribensis]MCO4876637.1 hypothetical protein [Paraburkholderia caribensis]MDR6386780.1 hypothetical protein [Paraburkholderia caribensis]
MDEPESFGARTPFQLCTMAEEHDEALADVMALAEANSELDLRAAIDTLAEIHELVKGYLVP